MIVGGRIPRFLPFRPSSSLLLLRRREFCSVASSEVRFSRSLALCFSCRSSRTQFLILIDVPSVFSQSSGECDVFLPWLQRKAGSEISSTLFIGFSKFGRLGYWCFIFHHLIHDDFDKEIVLYNCRSLFASKSIRAGDCILRVPFNVVCYFSLISWCPRMWLSLCYFCSKSHRRTYSLRLSRILLVMFLVYRELLLFFLLRRNWDRLYVNAQDCLDSLSLNHYIVLVQNSNENMA